MPPDPCQDDLSRFQTYLFSYEFKGARWSFEIPALSEAEAKLRLQKMAEAQYDGVLQFRIPVPASLSFWAARLKEALK